MVERRGQCGEYGQVVDRLTDSVGANSVLGWGERVARQWDYAVMWLFCSKVQVSWNRSKYPSSTLISSTCVTSVNLWVARPGPVPILVAIGTGDAMVPASPPGTSFLNCNHHVTSDTSPHFPPPPGDQLRGLLPLNHESLVSVLGLALGYLKALCYDSAGSSLFYKSLGGAVAILGDDTGSSGLGVSFW